MTHPIRRSTNDRWIAGVIGGLAEYLGIPATALRFLYVVVSIMSAAFPGMLVYLILWIALAKDTAPYPAGRYREEFDA